MILKVGNKVVYPGYGPCRIGALVTKEFNDKRTNCYPLTVMDNSGVVLFVPVDKVKTLGIRQLMKKFEIIKLLRRLGKKGETVNLPTTVINWKQRTRDNSALLASGSAFDLAKLIGLLTELNEKKALSPRDHQVLDEARKNLICEISEVIGQSKSAVEARLDDALNIKISKMRNFARLPLRRIDVRQKLIRSYAPQKGRPTDR